MKRVRKQNTRTHGSWSDLFPEMHTCNGSVLLYDCAPSANQISVNSITIIRYVAPVRGPTLAEIYHAGIVNAVRFYLCAPTRLMETGARTAFHVISKT